MRKNSLIIKLKIGLIFLIGLSISACTNYHKPLNTASLDVKVAGLTKMLLNLDHSVQATEARQLAKVAVYYPIQLRQDYKLVDSPLVHNALVNAGIKDRGLCIHWTEDLLLKLSALKLKSLRLNWMVANQTSNFRLEHSAVAVSSVNQDAYSGLILDGWRNSGEIYFSSIKDDKYDWKLQYNDITEKLLFNGLKD